MGAVDPRLLRHARAARTGLIVTVLLGLVVTGLIVLQAALLAHALAAAALGTGAKALAGTLVLLLGVVVARAAAAYGGEAAALRAAARVKSQLRRKLIRHCLRLAPASPDGERPKRPKRPQRPGEIAVQATRGLDGLDPYFARFLPQLVLSVLVPVAVMVTVTATDWISGVVIAITLPLIPLFAALVGLHTKAATRRQWRLLAQLGGHFLDVVQGLPTLKAFGRAKFQEQVIAKVTDEHELQSPACRDVLGMVISAIPPGSALAATSRDEQPELPRLRATADALEFGPADLALDAAGARQIFASARVSVTLEQAAAVTERTEGWPVGLYLAALIARQDPGQAQALSGADRYVADYLHREALIRQPKAIQRFLRRTAVLDQLCLRCAKPS